jgi:ketosteroid isomerase-like protein
MSRESVEIVRRALESFGHGDLDASLAFMDPEVEWRGTGLFPGVARVYRGHDGYTRFWDDFRATWDGFEVVYERLLDHGDRVVVFGRLEASGRDGITVTREIGILFAIRDGLVTLIEAFPSGEQALEAVGLRE